MKLFYYLGSEKEPPPYSRCSPMGQPAAWPGTSSVRMEPRGPGGCPSVMPLILPLTFCHHHSAYMRRGIFISVPSSTSIRGDSVDSPQVALVDRAAVCGLPMKARHHLYCNQPCWLSPILNASVEEPDAA